MKTTPQLRRNLIRRVTIIFLAGLIAALPLQGVLSPALSAAETGTWVDGDMPQLTLGSSLDDSRPKTCFPETLSYHSYTKPDGSFDSIGRTVDIDSCITGNELGFMGRSGGDEYSDGFDFIRPKTTTAFRVVDFGGRSTRIYPVPNQAQFYHFQNPPFSSPAKYIRIFNSFRSSGSFEPDQSFNRELVFRINLSSVAPLKDNNGNNLEVMGGYATSSNGEWMILETSVGIVRVELATRTMQLVSTERFNYNLGMHPALQLAISNDGNSAIRGSSNISSTVAYDLSGCRPAPILPPVGEAFLAPGCRSRSVHADLMARVSGFVGIVHMRFNQDGKSVRGALYRTNTQGARETLDMTYSWAGYQPLRLSYLALGDSFSSGEGEMDDSYYVAETNTSNPKNQCHVSIRSYPYLAANALGLEGTFHSVACSGARLDPHYRSKAQYLDPDALYLQPGSKKQSDFVLEASPDVVTISMIGNDVDFGNKIRRCLMPDSCFTLINERKTIAKEINSKFDKLVTLYNDIKVTSGGAKVYVLGYPQLFNPANGCNAFNIGLDRQESIVANQLASYLDATIKAAAAKAGVVYIDVEHAFIGKQLCNEGADIAVNGVSKKGTESFHPNSKGHKILAQQLLMQSQSFELAMPAPDASAHAPTQDSQAYSDFMLGALPGGIFSRATYEDVVSDTLYWGITNAIDNIDLPLRPTSSYRVWLHSEPVYLGELTTNEAGELSGEITIPHGVDPGYHTLHIYGKNIAGEDVDLYKTVYVAASENDYDGDGTTNEDEECLITDPVGVDYDRDSIDDACDPEITEPPADSTSPEVIGSPDREPNESGWYNADVTINWNAVDPEPSSGAPIRPVPTAASQEGAYTYTSDQSCDPLNNCATGTLELKIDKTAPDITYSLSPTPNASGWNNNAVTVTFDCFDATSGVASCSEPETVSGADGAYVVTGSVTDNAGNTGAINVFVSLDSTAPAVSQYIFPAANSDGWHNSDVIVTPTCDDSLAGILTCSPAVTLTTEGANQSVESTAEDNAGNIASAAAGLNIDKTAPTLGTASWSNNPKSVLGAASIILPASDNLSGLAEAEYYLGDSDPGLGNGATMQVGEDSVSVGFNTDFPTGVYKVTVRAKDKAGNWSQTVTDYLVVYDPFGTRLTGKHTLIPSLSGGDILPGLVATNQDYKAKFGFNVRYDNNGQIHKNSDFQFKYETGVKCNKPGQAQNCHAFELNAISIAWLTTQGQNDSTGIFQGTAKLEVDGVASNVIFRLTGLDGERLDTISEDHLALKVYAEGANPNTAEPIYLVDADVLRGNIKLNKW